MYVCRRHHDFGKQAITAYKAAASALLGVSDWVEASFRLLRALHIGARIKAERDAIVAHVVNELQRRCPDDSYFSAKLLDTLAALRVGEPSTLAALARDAAAQADTAADWHRKREYLLLEAHWLRKAGDEASAKESHRQAAESYVDLASTAPQHAVKAAHLHSAIRMLRQVGGQAKRIEELHADLLAAEKDSISELKEHLSKPIDLSESVRAAREHVSGQDLTTTVIKMATIIAPSSKSTLRHAVLQRARMATFQYAIARTSVSLEGKTVARRGPIVGAKPEEAEIAIRQEMFTEAGLHRELRVVATLEPARAQIEDEHLITERDLMRLLASSPFVPPGREELFARGLRAGFAGLYCDAVHLLVPQVEHAIRCILADAGAITSGLDDEGLQREKDLGGLLYTEEASKVFGEDILFELQGLLVEKNGTNFRNLLAHGLLTPEMASGAPAAYVWWLTLYLCILPILTRTTNDAPEAAPDPESETDGSDTTIAGAPEAESEGSGMVEMIEVKIKGNSS